MLTLEGDIHRYGNTVGDANSRAKNVFYLFTNEQRPDHFMPCISHPLYPNSSPEKKIYILSKKLKIQLIVITWQDLLDVKTLYQVCH